MCTGKSIYVNFEIFFQITVKKKKQTATPYCKPFLNEDKRDKVKNNREFYELNWIDILIMCATLQMFPGH